MKHKEVSPREDALTISIDLGGKMYIEKEELFNLVHKSYNKLIVIANAVKQWVLTMGLCSLILYHVSCSHQN